MWRSIVPALAVAGLSVCAAAQVTLETSWRFNGSGAEGLTKVGGPAEMYRADNPVYAGPGTVTTALGLPIEGLTDLQDVFGTCSSFGLPNIGGSNRTVYKTSPTRDLRGGPPGTANDAICHVLWPATLPASPTAIYVFSFGADLLIPSSVPEGGRCAFINDGYGNYNGADSYINVEVGGDITFEYRGARVSLGVQRGQWFRLISLTNYSGGTFTTSVYSNGTLRGVTGADWIYNDVNPSDPRYLNGDPVPPAVWTGWNNRPNVFTQADGELRAGLTLFGNYTGVGESYYVANFYFGEGTFCDAAAVGLGGPSSNGFPLGFQQGSCAYNPTLDAAFTPNNGDPGETVLLTADVTPGTNPPSQNMAVTADLSGLGGSATAPLLDNGTNGDATAGDGVYSRLVAISNSQAPGPVDVLVTATDHLARTGTDTAGLIVNDPSSGTLASQWDFESGTLSASFGNGEMRFWDRVLPGGTASITNFGTTTSYGIPGPGGENANVMHTARYFGEEGFVVDAAVPGNNGGVYVNAYTLIVDVYIPANGDRSDWFPFHNTNCTNSNDADAYLDLAGGSAGIGFLGYSAPGTTVMDSWMRLAFVYDLRSNGAESQHWIYRDGQEIHYSAAFGDFEGRMALYSTTDGEPGCDTFHLFTEPEGLYTSEAYINSIYFVDRALTSQEVADLAGPDADGIYPPEDTCTADYDGDGFVTGLDFDAFVADFEAGLEAADYDGDGFVTGLDFDAYVLDFEAGC